MALYIHESLCCRSIVSHPSLEFLSIIVGTRAGPVLVGLLYCPPSAGPSLDDIETCVTMLGDSYSCESVVIMGDFNVDLFKSQECLALDLVGVMSSVGLSQVVLEATRVTLNSSSLIDHVYVSSLNLAESVVVGAALGTSDHQSVTFTLGITRSRPSKHRRRVWLYSRVDFQALNDELLEKLGDGFSGNSAEAQWQGLKRDFMSVVEKHVPTRSISCRKRLPWISTRIINMMRRRDKICKQASRCGCGLSFVLYGISWLGH